MKASEMLTQIATLTATNEAAFARLDEAQAERTADEFAQTALAGMGKRPAAFKPTAGGSIRMSADVVDAAMEDDLDLEATIDGLAVLPVAICKAILAASGLLEEIDDPEYAAQDRRRVATDEVLSNIVRYLRALPPAKRELLMSELAQKWEAAQSAMIAQARTENGISDSPSGRYHQ